MATLRSCILLMFRDTFVWAQDICTVQQRRGKPWHCLFGLVFMFLAGAFSPVSGCQGSVIANMAVGYGRCPVVYSYVVSTATALLLSPTVALAQVTAAATL